MGDLHLGVRSTTADVDAILQRVLTGHHAPGLDAPANFSLFVAPEPEARGRRELHVLYKSREAVARARHVGPLVHTLIDYLGDFAHAGGHDLLRIDASIVVGRAGVMLAPASAKRQLADFEAKLRRRHLGLVKLPSASIDLVTGELVVPAPSLSLDHGSLEALGHAGTARLDPGRYPIAKWALVAPGVEALSRAQAVAVAVRATTNVAEVGAARALGALAQVLATATPVPVASGRPADVVDGLSGLAAGAG